MGFPEKFYRVVIENVKPEIDSGRFPIKRTVGQKVTVEADVYCDGTDVVSAWLLYKKDVDSSWSKSQMRSAGNDRWVGEFYVNELGTYKYTVMGFIDRFETLRRSIKAKLEGGSDFTNELILYFQLLKEAKGLEELGERLQELARNDLIKAAKFVLSNKAPSVTNDSLDEATIYDKELEVVVERRKASFSTWYELFPRSTSQIAGQHGTFKDCERLLPEIARMGFDVLYFPPIHPIGKTNRKGRNNAPESRPEDPGSPWAIGSEEGGHKSVHPQLGTLEDFERLVRKAREFGIEIALDLAFQCSPDHPYLREHPSWFRRLPDGSIQYAENPPKRYEDVVPFDFETKDWKELWKELRSIVLFWVEKGVRIFRVDNPHTKPFSFWEWLINDVRKNHPDVIFLSEAFTRPKVMYRLAKLGFSQSYTYFTWRNTKKELVEYFTELTQTEVKEYFRPNLWPNTPDILPEYLQHGGRPAFITRLVLAATLSPNYGIYGPAFELCVDDAIPDKEEYLNSEKYEVKNWDRGRPDSLKELITRVNKIRKENPALQESSNLTFCDVDNDFLISYLRTTEDLSNVILVVVNLDPFNIQSGWLKLPLLKLCVEQGKPYLLHDLLSDEKHIWHQERNQITIDPKLMPAKVFSLKRRMRKESDFEYYL